jgi:surface protein
VAPPGYYLNNEVVVECTKPCSPDQFLDNSACTGTTTTNQAICKDSLILIFDLDLDNTRSPRSPTSLTVGLPAGGTVNIVIDWGDGSDLEPVLEQGQITHTYPDGSSGLKTVKVSGSMTRFGYGSDYSVSHDYQLMLVEVVSFGNLGITSLSSAWPYAKNLAKVPLSLPPEVTDLRYLFYEAHIFNQDIGGWDMGSVTDMTGMFQGAWAFNQNIGGWNVSNVSSMRSMFSTALAFNQDLDDWDVSNVSNMDSMFSRGSFNGRIGAWEMSAVEDINYMFYQASNFNQNISAWDVSNVKTMISIFSGASSFDQPLNAWDVSSVINMSGVFAFSKFNQPLDKWSMKMTVQMDYMFFSASSFDQNISGWDVSSVTDMSYMFSSASSFDQNISGWSINSDIKCTSFVNASSKLRCVHTPTTIREGTCASSCKS